MPESVSKKLFGVWRTVWLLGSLSNRIRHEMFRGILKNVLLIEACHFQSWWQFRAKLDQAVVEERETPFDAVGHRHPVAL